jgi:predicted amidophosphoribosyltransferase
MSDYTEKTCPECDQVLRFPRNIGGMLMACPSCGHKFHSDFKLSETAKSESPGILTTVFEFPYKFMSRIVRSFFPK